MDLPSMETSNMDDPRVTRSIIRIRQMAVILDSDLAALYGVSTKRLNEQVKRNRERFPADFMFKLTPDETDSINRSQSATGSAKHRNPRFPPFAFTEHGAIQSANILSSPRAVEMGVLVVRAFIRLREMLINNEALARQVEELERKYRGHDDAIATILDTIRQLIQAPERRRRGIGFTADLD